MGAAQAIVTIYLIDVDDDYATFKLFVNLEYEVDVGSTR